MKERLEMSALRKWGKTTALLAAFAMLGLTQIGCNDLIKGLVEDECRDACQEGPAESLDECLDLCDQIPV